MKKIDQIIQDLRLSDEDDPHSLCYQLLSMVQDLAEYIKNNLPAQESSKEAK